MNLSYFRKPSRYINSELNAAYKKSALQMALCFPDVYEIGMSHIGMKILYKLINDIPYASCDRVFAPWIDMEAYMKNNAVPLCSIEHKTPLKDFDVVGFTLQYELCYTTVLNMLQMGGIPIKSAERSGKVPLVIAGGPCTVNPYPVLPFFDAFLVGDGEDAVREILETCYTYKLEGDGSRGSLLAALSEIEGVLVPAFAKKSVRRRYVSNLDACSFPTSPVIPYMDVVHNRIAIEIARGCTCGCRFCQAGTVYRPVRERSPESVLTIAEASLASTGYDEVSFTSLSAGDYSRLPELLSLFNRRFSDSMVSFSLPSLRVSSITEQLMMETKVVRKSGFTIAPEAASDRLRSVINKNFDAADYERALYIIFKEGWLHLKLYFMIGLPTETDQDVEAIRDMVVMAMKTARKFTKRHVNINVGVSTFIPKPHTPFQWCAQIPVEEMNRKRDYLKKALRLKDVKLKEQNTQMSFLEAVFARGDSSVAALIESAWREGAYLDPWSEVFDYGKWLTAMDKTSIDGNTYTQKAYDDTHIFAWDNIDVGVTRDYLLQEYNNAINVMRSPDCRTGCLNCGMNCGTDNTIKNQPPVNITDAIAPYSFNQMVRGAFLPVRVRVVYSKKGLLRFLSHLELVSVLLKALRRACVPLVYSQGFHPTANLSFCQPLGVGVAGENELFDMEVYPPYDVTTVRENLNALLPEGIAVKNAFFISRETESPGRFITSYSYEITTSESITTEFVDERLHDPENSWISSILLKFDIIRDTVCIHVKDTQEKMVKVSEIAEAITGLPFKDVVIARRAMYGWRNQEWVDATIRQV